ncbi:hypothetical protein [Parafilimonas terrae]|uniref:Uncharacterized protein n=1 Tax=Parafilimonas terrae TaxID=1465490 RepID=A0A1I5YJ55_9BACT|nr:hypothetical protein [Parafilimonas terrae]SFQ44208.1 hypothetical protein SAMN05444277_112100 [Parafilimonas terrae]
MQTNINILNELKEAGAATLIQANNENYYSVPEGYFSNLSSHVIANIFVSELTAVNPYTVPENYFENFPDIILDKINAPSLQLPGSKREVFGVPDGYFDEFANKVIEKIKAQKNNDVKQELEEISPLLNTISRENLYSLPPKYFDELAPLKYAGKNEPSAKIISIGSKPRRWINYAAAACIGAVLFGGGYFFISGNNTRPAQITQPVAAAAKADIQQQLADISDSEIESYLNENNSMAVFTGVGADYQPQNQNTDIQILIKDIPDDEIRQYLNEGEDLKKEEGI